VHGSYNAVWVRGAYGEDTFYYGRGAGSRPTGGRGERPYGAWPVRSATAARARLPVCPRPLWRVRAHPHQPPETGRSICASAWSTGPASSPPGSILAAKRISLDAVLQLPAENKGDLPFVITVEPTPEEAVREAIDQMSSLDFLLEPPLASHGTISVRE